MWKKFDELRILEVCGSAAGAFAGKLFSDYGIEVVKLEPPGGDPARRAATGASDKSPVFAYLNAGKRSRSLDLDSSSGSRELRDWLAWADVVIESAAPDPLVARVEGDEHPHLVEVRISPFGGSGPYAAYRSHAFTDDAIGGYTFLNGDPRREPLTRPGLLPVYQAGVQAFIGAMAAIRVRARTGRGQRVEVSHLEGLVGLHQHTISAWTHARHALTREGNRQPGFYHPIGIYPCKDGWVQLSLPGQPMRERFLVAIDQPEILLDPRFENDMTVAENKDAFDEAILPALRRRTGADLVRLGQSVGCPVGPVPSLLQVLEDPHLEARGFWVPLESGGRTLKRPGGPFEVSGRERIPRPPPQLGDLSQGPRSGRRHPEPSTRRPRAGGPLSGLVVLDLTRVWAGPLAARFFADLGADVILIEAPAARGGRKLPPRVAEVSHMFPDEELGERPWNRFGPFNELARNRRGVTLDLKRPEAKRVFEKLVTRADLLIENFTPRVMPKLGFDLARLHELNPRLNVIAISGYGQSGPYRDRAAFGPVLEAGTGFSDGMGYADSGPIRSGVAWSDPVTALLAVAGGLIALHDRDADPAQQGRVVEVSMLEATLSFLGERFLEAQLTGRDPERSGNRHPDRAPQGCYPCSGDDRWLAISVSTDTEWRALCRVAGFGAELFALDARARRERHDEIDLAIATWTRRGAPCERMAALQEAGVIAAAVSDAKALCEDPQLAARDYWADVTHPDAGRHLEPGCAIRFSETPVQQWRAAPRLGEHNAEVLQEVAGLGRQEIAELEALGILVDTPP